MPRPWLMTFAPILISFSFLVQICIVCDTGQLVRRGRNFNVRGFLSDGSETPELSLRPLFEEYHSQVGG
jgi:hypothetical protein